jgi:hypothetical protein
MGGQAETVRGDTEARGRELSEKGNALHGGHRGHGGGWAVRLKLFARTPRLAGEN